MPFSILLRITAVLLLSLAVALPAAAQDKDFDSPNFPVPFGPDNIGTDFYLSFPANWELAAGEKYVRLYISSGVETRVTVKAGLFRGEVTTIPNDIVTIDMPNIAAQAFVRNDQAPVPDDQIYEDAAVIITAEDPIIVYGMNRTQFTSDGLLAIPTNGLGRRYIVASARSVADGVRQELPSQFMVVAPYDNTIVTMEYTFRTPNHQEGDKVSVTMNSGDVYSAMSLGFRADLSGTFIYSNNPIAVMGGQNCTYLPDERYPACDHIVEMLPPMETWGTVYHSVPFQDRTKGDTYRIFAGAPDAEIFLNGVLLATLPNIGGVNGSGWIEYRQDERIPMEFTSDKPIYVAQYNNSQRYDQSTATDPFFMNLSPIEQYQTDLIFSTPGADFATNYVQIVCDSAGLDSIEIARAGTDDWTLVTRAPGLAGVVQFPSEINGLKYRGLTLSIQPGVWRLRGPRPMAGYIYGGGSFDSYGYPLSVALGNLESPDEDKPVFNFVQECDGSAEGSVIDMPDDNQIRSNLSTVRLHPNSMNYELDVDDFRPGVDRGTNFRLRVVDPAQDGIAILIATDMAANVGYDTVEYFARDLEFLPDPLDFGELFVDEEGTLNVSITNNGAREIDLLDILLQRGNRGFEIISPEGGTTLGANGGWVDVQIRFVRPVTGDFLDSLGIVDDCDTTWFSEMRARVVQPVISVTDWDFGRRPLAAPPIDHDIEISNVGTGTLTVTGHESGPNDPVFTLPNGLPAFPLQLGEGARQTLTVRFRPTAAQPYSDAIIFTHNAPPSDANDSIGLLDGEGITATLFATSYDWPRKRVGTGPYLATVDIVNSGSADARVFGILDRTGPNTADFEADTDGQLQNETIRPGEQITVGVSFSPQAVGNRRDTVIWDVGDPQNRNVYSVLTGIGIVPGLATNDLDFGSLIIGDPENTRTVTFRLDGDPQWRDTVWIERFDFVSDNANGTDDFRYELTNGETFPIMLVPGESNSVEITGYFTPQAGGQRNASILAITRDGVDTVSRWVGQGTTLESRFTVQIGTSPDICLDTEDTINVTITSTGDAPLSITTISLDTPGVTEFEIVDAPTLPIDLAPGESITVRVAFRPTGTNGPRTTSMVVATDATDTPIQQFVLEGIGSQYTITGQVELLGTIDRNEDGTTEAVLGEEITARVVLDEGLDGVGATSYKIVLTYDPGQFLPPTSVAAITLNPAVHPAGSQAVIDPATTAGRLVLSVNSPTPFTGTGQVNLLGTKFGVIFNADLVRGIDVESVSFGSDASCATIAVTGDEIDVDPICGLNLRLIDLVDGAKYALTGATPNPVTTDMVEIEYTIALEAPTLLQIVDPTGNVVGTVVNQHQQPGTYRVAVDARTLASGLYYLRLESNQFEETKVMMVRK